MRTMDELKSALEGKAAEMATALKGMEEGKDAAEKAAAKSAYDTAAKAHDELVSEAKAVRAHADRIAAQREIEMETAKSTQAEVPATLPAAAKDHSEDAKKHMDIFLDFVAGKELSGEAFEFAKPVSEKMRERAKAIRVPDSILIGMFGAKTAAKMIGGERFARAMGKTMTSDDATGGANLVPEVFVAELQRLPLPFATLMDRVTMRPAQNGNLTYPMVTQTDLNEFGGMTWEWKTEGSEKPNTDVLMEQVKIECHELCGYTEVSNTMLRRSAIDVPGLIGELGRGGLRYMIDAAIVSGTGVNQPLGLVNAGIRTVARITADEVNDDDLVNLKHAVRPMHRAGSMFIVGDDVEQDLELKKDNENRPLFRASTATGPYDRLAGYPYAIGMNQPALGTSGDVIFGNPAGYVLAVDAEITIAQSPHYRFRNNVTAFVMYANVGGRPMQPRAFAMLDSAS